jgi:hypothetical protein
MATPRWSQDQPTYILLGRFAHLYNATFGLWFTVDAGQIRLTPLDLQRPGSTIERVPWREFKRVTGRKMAWMAMFEQLSGIRVAALTKKLLKVPMPEGLRKRLRKVAVKPACQDFEEYDRTAEPPRVFCG